MAGQRLYSDEATLLLGIKAQLLTVFTNVFISITPEPLTNPPNDIYTILIPGAIKANAPAFTGGGRAYMRLDGQFSLCIWVRLMLDQDHRDDSFWTDASLGAVQAWNSTMNALEGFDVADGSSNYLTAQPIRLLDRPRPQKTNLPGWGYLASNWELIWNQTLT